MGMLKQIRTFYEDQRASVTVEVVMVLPLLLWGYFGLFVLFDGYRALSANIRVAYTVSDMISRETEMNGPFIEGLNDLQDVLTQSPHRTVLRVTAVSYDADADDHELEWSYSTAGKTAVAAGSMSTEIEPYLPVMSDTEWLIVVETWMAFVPFLSITLDELYGKERDPDAVFGPFYFESLVTTRPRFAGQLCWTGSQC